MKNVKLQDVLIKIDILTLVISLHKTSSRRLNHDEHIRLCDTPSRRLQDIFKTSSGRLGKISLRNLPDVFKMYHQVKLLLSTRPEDIFETFSPRFFDVLGR